MSLDFPRVSKLGKMLHPRKPTWHLKMDSWKKRFLLETIIFRVYVSFRGCKGRNPVEIFENTSGFSDGSAHLSFQGSNMDLHTGQANAYAVGPWAGEPRTKIRPDTASMKSWLFKNGILISWFIKIPLHNRVVCHPRHIP